MQLILKTDSPMLQGEYRAWLYDMAYRVHPTYKPTTVNMLAEFLKNAPGEVAMVNIVSDALVEGKWIPWVSGNYALPKDGNIPTWRRK